MSSGSTSGLFSSSVTILGPLFLIRDGTTLSKPRLIGSLRQVLLEVGVDSALVGIVSV